MIKRIIACLTICLIITGLVNPVFSDASALPQPNWSDPGISEIINISDLTGWMLNGGTYDVSTYTDAESFMNDYYSARTKTKLEGSDYVVKHYYGIEEMYYDIGDSAYIHPLDVNRAISSAFRDHVGYGRRFSEQVNDALLSTGNLYDTKIPLLNEVEFANFVGYNHDALRLYSEFFDSEPDIQTYAPDWAVPYLNKINGSSSDSFFWANYPNPIQQYNNSNRLFTLNNGNWSDFTWITTSNNIMETSTHTAYVNGVDLLTINITSNNGIYSVYFSGSSTSYITIPNNTSNWALKFNNDSSTVYDFSSISNLSLSYSGTIENVLIYLSNKVRNANILVDNQIWSVSGTFTHTTVTPEFPDAIGGEDLPSTTWPVHRPLAPYFITAPGMLQAIQDAIDDDGELDIDDLKPYLIDENGDPVPDPQFDPEPVPIPVPDPVNPDVVPGLPVLPAMPPEMPGFNGVSVLAEIINFTNQSLPTYLIVTFWGIVFGIVILGLIKILHK